MRGKRLEFVLAGERIECGTQPSLLLRWLDMSQGCVEDASNHWFTGLTGMCSSAEVQERRRR